MPERDIWKHGKYFDLWSLVHFLSGTLLANIFYFFGLSFAWSALATLVIVILWEVIEAILRIIESRTNVLMDIIIGMLGFYAMAHFYYDTGWLFSPHLFWSLVFITGGLSLWGFIDFTKRGYR